MLLWCFMLIRFWIYVWSQSKVLLGWWLWDAWLRLRWNLLESWWIHFMLTWSNRYSRIGCRSSLSWTCFIPARGLVWLVLSAISCVSLLSKPTRALTLIVLAITMFRFMACLRCLWVETGWLWERLAAIWLSWNTWICPMPLAQYFRIILILCEFILILVHDLLYGILASFTSSSWSAQVVYRASSWIRFLVVHWLRLHVLMEMALLLKVASWLRAGLVGPSSWNNISWLGSTSLLCWFTVISLVELLSSMLLAIVRVVSVLVAWLFRVALLPITAGFRIFSILTWSTSSKIALSWLGCRTTYPVSWILRLCFSLASNTSLVFISKILIWLIHLLAFRHRLFGWATRAHPSCASQTGWLSCWSQLLLWSVFSWAAVQAEVIGVRVKVPL